MLNKNRPLATLLLFCFLGSLPGGLKAEWQSVEFQALLEPGVYLTKQRWRIKPDQIVVPRFDQVTPQNSCFQSNMVQFLQHQIIQQPTKLKFTKTYLPQQLNRVAQIKFNKTSDLAEFMLRQGWAQLNSDIETPLKAYQAAQAEAQSQRRGVWGSCDNWYKLREAQRLKGLTQYFNQAHKSYLQPVSTGWVKKVMSPNLIVLSNGQKIKLQAVRVPVDDSLLAQCWQQEVTPVLEKLVLGKKVRLESDHLQLTSKGRQLQRFVWLEGNRWQSPLLLNQYLIDQNLAQLEDAELNLKYIDILQNSAQSALSNTMVPQWWKMCAHKAINETRELLTQSPKSLVYDENCPIKGNIAGSKKNPKKTYHTPASGWYKRIEAEACFTNELEAETAGFTKVK